MSSDRIVGMVWAAAGVLFGILSAGCFGPPEIGSGNELVAGDDGGVTVNGPTDSIDAGQGHRPPARDGGAQSPDLEGSMSSIVPGAVGPHGGTVNLLHFGVSGDTRPKACEDTASYPTAVINGIGDALRQDGAQFALDLGDHMYVCNNDLTIATEQMNLFVAGTQHFGGTWFMTEGNHECWKGPCLAGSTNANYVAFMAALNHISTTPYYSFHVETSMGRATFVVIADNSWDSNQSNWLESTLSDADKNSTYTIVARHHPEGDSTVSTNSTSIAIVRKHKFALLLTGHDHLYKHMTTDSGRDLVLGCSGAPLIAGGSFFGYGVIDQKTDGRLYVSIYDLSTKAVVDSWSVAPN